jgi:type II secretory pathway pseudopilin PulG
MVIRFVNRFFAESPNDEARPVNGFTLVEVMVAASIMIILCVGLLTVFSYVTKINRGENLRMQALSVLQKEVEHYRSLKFIPGAQTTTDLNNHRSLELRAGTHTRPPKTSSDGRVFNITVTVVNIAPPSTAEEFCRFKEITITAVPQVAEQGWLANLRTNVTIQRVRSN